MTIGVTLALPLIVVVYDLLSRRRIHRSTAIGCILIESVILTAVPLAQLPLWSHCVALIRDTDLSYRIRQTL